MFRFADCCVSLVFLFVCLAVVPLLAQDEESTRWVFPQAAVGPFPRLGSYQIELRLANGSDFPWAGRLKLLEGRRLAPMQGLRINNRRVVDASDIDLVFGPRESQLLRIVSTLDQVQVGVAVIESDLGSDIRDLVPAFDYRLVGADGVTTDLISVPPAPSAEDLRGLVARSSREAFQVGVAFVRDSDLDPAGFEERSSQGSGVPDLELVLTELGPGLSPLTLRTEFSFGGDQGLQAARLMGDLFPEAFFEKALLEVHSNVGPIHAVLIGFGAVPDFEDIQNGVVPLMPFQPNRAPLVNAGEDRSVILGAQGSVSVELAGEVSDPEGDLLTLLWTAVGFPSGGTAQFARPNQASTIVVLNRAGTYTIRLRASDGRLNGDGLVRITVEPNQPPFVSAGNDQTARLGPNGRVTLPLLGEADDPGGDPLTFLWSAAGGPGGVTFSAPTALQTDAVFPAVGTYRIRLAASDGVLSNSDETVVTIRINRAPEVNAGPDQTVSLSPNFIAVVTLTGVVTDPDGHSTSAQWSVVRAPSGAQVEFADPRKAETDSGYRQAGNYTLRLTGSDGELSASDDVVITVTPLNSAPVVNAGPDRTVSLGSDGTLRLSIMGTVTDDGLPPGGTLSVRWSLGSGPANVSFEPSNRAATTAFFITAGTYLLRLTASDGQLVDSDKATITVTPPNQAPVVNAGPDRTASLNPGSTVALTLSGGVLDDGVPVGSVLALLWSQVSGPAAAVIGSPTNLDTIVTFTQTGIYVFRFLASDGLLQSSDEVTVTVVAANQPPVVNAGGDQTVFLGASSSVTANLLGSVRDDGLPAGGTLTIQWLLGIGPGAVSFGNANQPVTTAVFTLPGVYVLRLRANDGQLTESDEVTVTVVANRPPIVSAGADRTVQLGAGGNVTIELQGEASDPDGDLLSLLWTVVLSPDGGSVSFSNAAIRKPTATFTGSGVYRLRFTAGDGLAQTFSEVQITVNPAS